MRADRLVISLLLLIIVNAVVLMFKLPAIIFLNVFVLMIFGYFFYKQFQYDKERKRIEKIYSTDIEKIKEDNSNYFNRTGLILDNLPSPIVFMNASGLLEVINPLFSRLIKDYDVTNKYNYDDYRIKVEVTMVLKQIYGSVSPLLQRLPIEQKEYQVIASPLEEKGDIVGWLVILQDLTKVLQGEKIQKRFIADASHELKTPVSAIKGMLEILTSENFDDDKTRDEFLKQMTNDTNRMELLIKEMLESSRISSDKVILQKSYCDLKAIIDAVLKSLSSLSNNKIKIENNFENKELFYCDAEKMYTVFNNIILNALKYTKAGVIDINSKWHEKQLTIIISDTGIGIEKNKLPHIFERFYRTDKSRDINSGGFGLGLAITKEIIEAHNGSIQIKSEVNKGTSVIIKLTNS